MRISDWSSDVCSSDLEALEIAKAVARLAAVGVEMDERQTIRVGPPVAGVDSDVVVHGHLPAESRCQLLVARRLRYDRNSVVSGKRVSVRVDLGGRRNRINKYWILQSQSLIKHT